MNMIERVARAIMLDDFEGDDMWGRQPEGVRDSYLKNARAAIEAMRDPTDEMRRAAYVVQDDSAIHNYGGSPSFCDYWQTGIDAALAEGAQ